jgi:hypothetical protein
MPVYAFCKEKKIWYTNFSNKGLFAAECHRTWVNYMATTLTNIPKKGTTELNIRLA